MKSSFPSAFALASVFALSFASAFPQSVREEKPVMKLSKHSAPVTAVAYSIDGKILATGSEDKTVILWNTTTGEALYTLEGHVRAVSAVVFTPDGKNLITAGDRNIQIWTLDGKKVKTLLGATTDVRSLAISPDGTLLAAGSYDKKIPVWDIPSGKVVKNLEGHLKSTLSVCWSPNGKYLVSGSLDETIRLWDVYTGTCLKVWTGHAGNIYGLAFSPDSKYVLSGAKDKSLRLWDVSLDKSIHSYIGHQQPVTSVKFANNGQWMISGSYDLSVYLWEVFSGARIYQFIGFDGPVNALALDPSGQFFATASSDNKVLIWKLNPSLFVDYYYEKEVQQAMDSSNLFRPRGKSESKEDYEKRQIKADKQKDEIYSRFYKLYLEKLSKEVK
jgi:WD40 repeat protein